MLPAAPAEAIVYQFDNVTADFRSDGSFLGFRWDGTAAITGSFDYLGGTGPGSLGAINVAFTSGAGNTASFAFTSGYYNAAAQRLVFGLTSGSCPSGTTTCLGLALASGLTNTPFQAVGFNAGQDSMGDYFNSSNSDKGTSNNQQSASALRA